MQEENSVELDGILASSAAPTKVVEPPQSSVKRLLQHVFCVKTANVVS